MEKKEVPKGLTRYLVCGEYGGVTEDGIEAICICEGILYPYCKKNKVRRSISNFYDEKNDRIWHIPLLTESIPFSECNARFNLERHNKQLKNDADFSNPDKNNESKNNNESKKKIQQVIVKAIANVIAIAVLILHFLGVYKSFKFSVLFGFISIIPPIGFIVGLISFLKTFFGSYVIGYIIGWVFWLLSVGIWLYLGYLILRKIKNSRKAKSRIIWILILLLYILITISWLSSPYWKPTVEYYPIIEK